MMCVHIHFEIMILTAWDKGKPFLKASSSFLANDNPTFQRSYDGQNSHEVIFNFNAKKLNNKLYYVPI